VVEVVVVIAVVEVALVDCHYLRFLLLMVVHTRLLWVPVAQLVILAEHLQSHTTTQFMRQLEEAEAQVLQVHYLVVAVGHRPRVRWDFLVISGQH
jgi:hypothetical protein